MHLLPSVTLRTLNDEGSKFRARRAKPLQRLEH